MCNSKTWIIDSGASEHMCFDPKFFLKLIPLSVPVTINLPNSYRIKVTHTESIGIFPNLTLQNVLFVPSFRYNLLSVHRFCSQFACILLFNPEKCVMEDLTMKRKQAFGEAREGLYLLEPVISSTSIHSQCNVVSLPEENNSKSVLVFPFSSSVISNVVLWHARLGHVPYSAMKNFQFHFTSFQLFLCVKYVPLLDKQDCLFPLVILLLRGYLNWFI